MNLYKTFRNPLALASISALLLWLSFPKFNFSFLAWVAFVPLFFSLRNERFSKTLLFSFVAGFIFFVLTIFWLTHVTIPGMFVFSFYLSLYFVIFGLGFYLIKKHHSFWLPLTFLPALWILLEFFRSTLLTGFAWVLLGYSQGPNLLALQVADLSGVYGVSFMVMFVNVFVFKVLSRNKGSRNYRDCSFIAPLLVIFLWLGYGLYRVMEDPGKTCPVKVSLVQGNIAQEIKWVPSFQEEIIKRYELLTELSYLKEEPDIIIWPETAFPEYLEFDGTDEPLKELAKKIKTPLLVGSIRIEEMRYYNSAILFSAKGTVAGIYDKLHLVPFGEYIPLRKYLPWVERMLGIEDFTRGPGYEIFSVPASKYGIIKFGVLICFEDTLGSMARTFVRKGADVLVNMTNDAWFGDSACPFQHLEASVLRAVENRVFVLRAANTGVSCFIDDTGRVIRRVHDDRGKATYVTGSETGLAYKTRRSSLYTQLGDYFVFLSGVYVFIMIFFSRRF
jgi:apolipoprotein N-acyltransferase